MNQSNIVKKDNAQFSVTIGTLPASQKTYIGNLKVAMREIALSGGEQAFTVYDTSGAYSDPN